MRLFGFLTKRKVSKFDEYQQFDRGTVEQRVHARFRIDDPAIARFSPDGVHWYSVMNISYSGLLLHFDGSAPELAKWKKADALPGRLALLDGCINITLRQRHVSGDWGGYSFDHSKPDGLLFLREPIEHLGYGATMSVIKSSNLAENLQGREWLVLRGDGSTDLVLRLNANTLPTAAEAHLTFRVWENYHDLFFKDGKLSASSMIDKTGLGSAAMGAIGKPEKAVLRRAFCILFGIPDEPTRQALEPMLAAIRKELEV